MNSFAREVNPYITSNSSYGNGRIFTPIRNRVPEPERAPGQTGWTSAGRRSNVGSYDQANRSGEVLYDDYTRTGTTRFEETDIYRRAINVSEQRPLENLPAPPPGFKQRVSRRVEVPYTRQVKVPEQITQIVPSVAKVQVPVKKFVEFPGFTVVDEEYTEFEDREAFRDKEVWVKQIVQERYIEKVPVRKIRQVQKPTTEVREIEELVDVDVPTTKPVQVDGFRIDNVEDTKLVEVEEFQEYEYQPIQKGAPELSRTQDVGRVPGSHLVRQPGSERYAYDHPKMQALETDDVPPYRQQFSSSPMNRQVHFEEPYRHNVTRPRPQSAAIPSTTGSSGGIGLSLKSSHGPTQNSCGLVITSIVKGGQASLAGLREGDIIIAVNRQHVDTVGDFGSILKQSSGPISVSFTRRGFLEPSVQIDR